MNPVVTLPNPNHLALFQAKLLVATQLLVESSKVPTHLRLRDMLYRNLTPMKRGAYSRIVIVTLRHLEKTSRVELREREEDGKNVYVVTITDIGKTAIELNANHRTTVERELRSSYYPMSELLESFGTTTRIVQDFFSWIADEKTFRLQREDTYEETLTFESGPETVERVHTVYPPQSIKEMFHEFIGIDAETLESERQMMLEAQRELSGVRE